MANIQIRIPNHLLDECDAIATVLIEDAAQTILQNRRNEKLQLRTSVAPTSKVRGGAWHPGSDTNPPTVDVRRG